MTRFAIALTVFLAFTTFSFRVVFVDGLPGLLAIHAFNGWGPQILTDLVIACVVVTFWLIPDARKHNISPWPFVVGIPLLGSVSTLAYITLREWKRMRTPSLAESSTRLSP
jgi:hypothetical protein